MMTSYGIKEQAISNTPIDVAVELIGLRGYAVVDGGYDAAQIAEFSQAFTRAYDAMIARHGADALEACHELDVIRMPLLYENVFLRLATNPIVLDIARRLIGDYIVLNQQNGVVNRARAEYGQARFHRDLPYQHFVSSRPLAISALYCVDPFTVENGATRMIPASHKEARFSSETALHALSVQTPAPAGAFLIFDSMLFHAGAQNRSNADRRGVNHMYTIPLIKPQIDFASALGSAAPADLDTRRLLGFDVRVPETVEAFYVSRRGRP